MTSLQHTQSLGNRARALLAGGAFQESTGLRKSRCEHMSSMRNALTAGFATIVVVASMGAAPASAQTDTPRAPTDAAAEGTVLHDPSHIVRPKTDREGNGMLDLACRSPDGKLHEFPGLIQKFTTSLAEAALTASVAEAEGLPHFSMENGKVTVWDRVGQIEAEFMGTPCAAMPSGPSGP